MSFTNLLLLFILLVCVYLFYTNRTFHYYVKFIFFNSMIMITAVAIIPLSLRKPFDVSNFLPLRHFWRNWMAWLVNFKVEMRNEENLSSPDPFIIVSNHQSSVDTIVMMHAWPDRCSPLAKKELMYLGPFGISAKLCGTVFIDRLNPEKARETMAKTSRTLHEQNTKLWIFPEGTRNHGIEFLPFKKGAFHLAVAAQIPIVPIAVSSYVPFLSKKDKYFEPGYAIVSALPPIPTKGLTAADVNKLTEDCREKMVEEFNKISHEIPDKIRQTYGCDPQTTFKLD